MQELREGFRLSPQQRRAWLLAQSSPAYRTACAVKLSGDLDFPRLRTSLEQVAARHDILRTTFHRAPGVKIPIQVVGAVPAVAWREVAAGPPAGLEALADEVLAAELAADLPFEAGPLLRATLVRGVPDRAYLLLVLPPLCADGAGLGRLLGELVQVWAGAADGLTAAEDLVQYVQFSEWQHELQESEEGEAGRAYWSARPGREEAIDLGVERLRGGNPPFAPAIRPLDLPTALAGELEAAAVRLEVSAADLLLAAWMAYLGRLSGRRAVEVEAVFDGRTFEELRQSIGLFRKSIPVTCAVSASSPFAELVARVSGAVCESAAWQDTFAAAGTEGRSAVAFEHEVWPSDITARGACLAVVRWSVCAEPFKLKLVASRRTAGLAAALHYDTCWFDAADVERLAHKLERLLAAVAAQPETAIADLELLSDAEREELVIRFNATARDYPRERCLHQLFAEQAARTPEAVALAIAGEEIDYRELAARSGRLAATLRRAGVGPDRRVGVCLDRSIDLVVALLGVLEAGGCYVPIDPLYPPERLAFMLADAGVEVVLTQRRSVSGLPAGEARLVCLDGDLDEAASPAPVTAAAVSPDNLAYVLYTSGSTGRPKGVMVPHRGVVNYLTWAIAAYGLEEGGSAPLHSPLGFDLTVTSLFGPLLSGGRVVLVPEERGIEGLSNELETNGDFSLIKLTPSFLEVINQLLTAEQLAGRSRALVLGGEALSGGVLTPWRTAAPETRLINEYGPTETVVGCAVYEVRSGDEPAGPVPIGRPITNLRLYLLDRRLRPVASGVAGHLHVAGDGLARGYLRRRGLTAERFIPDPFGAPGSRLYATGDLARFRCDGELEFLGRIDHQVKIRGYRIELEEVEAALVSHPAVRAAAVAAVGDEAGERRLVAYVVADPKEAGGSELRAWLAETLPESMIPTAFVPLPALPLTAHGKVDRAVLPQPDPNRPELRAPYVGPRTPVEEILAAIWPQVLGVEELGIDDNFFTLGGDSIRSVRAVALAKERGIECSVEQLLQFQTIRELAREVKTYEASSIPAVRSRPFSLIADEDREKLPGDVEDAYPLTHLQAGMLYHMGLDDEYPLYHNVNTWHLRSPSDRETFLAAVREVVGRHPVLRTSFDFTSYREPLQLVHRHADLPVEFADLRSLGPADQHRALQEFWERQRREIFDLADYPYVRLYLHRRTDESFQFTLVESHAILDGWSTTSTLAEIFELYLTLLSGRTPRIERPLAISFRDYVLMERMALESRECREYWDRHLAESQPTPLPRWPRHLRSEPDVQRGKLHLDLHEPTLKALRALARAVAVPLRSVLLAVHLKMLSWATGLQEVVSGVVTNGRPEQLDGERVRGLFLNTLPFRFRLPDGSWADLVREAFEIERGMLPFRRYPLAALQQRWGEGRRLFDAVFTFLHFHSVDRLLREQEVEILEDDEKDFSFNSFLLNVTFFLSPVLPQIRLMLEYDAREICREQVEAIRDVFLRMIERMTADPLAPHRADPLLAESERHRLLEVWGRGPAPPPPRPVHRLIREQAARTPERPAVLFRGTRLSYGELQERADGVAARLAALNLPAESVVGILMDGCPAAPVAILGALEAGAAYLPLDPGSPPARLELMLRAAAAPAVLTLPSMREWLAGYPGTVVCLDAAGSPEPESAAAPAPTAAGAADISPERLAYVIYTSGSTGRPKGVMITHRGLANYLLWASEAYRAGEGEGTLVQSSLAFDLTVTSLLAPLVAGGSVELVGEDLAVEGLAERLRERTDLNLLKLTPTHLELLLRQLPADELAGRARRLVLGGESLTWEVLRPWRQADPATEMINEYGPTETVVGCCVYRVGGGEEAADGSVPIGRPIAGTRLYVVDSAGQPVPVAAVGELLVGGAGLARGYLARPGVTAASFVPDPLGDEPGERLYRTGDRVRFRADGHLEFLGRLDDQVKIRGHRVELGEVETALRALPEIRDAMVVLQEESGESLLVGYAVPADGALPPSARLRAALLEQLPEYMVPGELVSLSALPLTAHGKVDRRALPYPGPQRRGLEAGISPPQNELQQAIAEIWQEVLKLDAVGIHQSFFEIGGNSIRLLEAATKLHQVCNTKIKLTELIRYPTIATLSEHLAAQEATPAALQAEERAGKLLRGREQLNEQFERMRRAPR